MKYLIILLILLVPMNLAFADEHILYWITDPELFDKTDKEEKWINGTLDDIIFDTTYTLVKNQNGTWITHDFEIDTTYTIAKNQNGDYDFEETDEFSFLYWYAVAITYESNCKNIGNTIVYCDENKTHDFLMILIGILALTIIGTALTYLIPDPKKEDIPWGYSEK